VWRPRGGGHSDITARAADVLDEELLTEALGELLRDDAPAMSVAPPGGNGTITLTE
jgi:hypothetical protein